MCEEWKWVTCTKEAGNIYDNNEPDEGNDGVGD